MRPSQFPEVAAGLGSGPRDAVIPIDSRMMYPTGSALLGDIRLRLEGSLTLHRNPGSFAFEGTLKSFDDYYDFNPSSHRTPLGEFSTGVGRFLPGKSYWIEIRGSRPIYESGPLPR